MPTNKKTLITAVSLRRSLLPAAKRRAKALGFENSFSAYLVSLLEKDLKEHGLPSEQKPPKKDANQTVEAVRRKSTGRVLEVEKRLERRQKARRARLLAAIPAPQPQAK